MVTTRTYLGQVVEHGEDSDSWEEELLGPEVLQWVDDSEESLQRHRHRDVHGAHAGDVKGAVAERDDVDEHFVGIPRNESIRVEFRMKSTWLQLPGRVSISYTDSNNSQNAAPTNRLQ